MDVGEQPHHQRPISPVQLAQTMPSTFEGTDREEHKSVSQTTPTDVCEKLRPSVFNEKTASQAPPTGVGEKLRPFLSNTNTVLHTPPIDVGEQPRPSLSRADTDNDVRGRYMLRKRKGVKYRDARPYVAKEK